MPRNCKLEWLLKALSKLKVQCLTSQPLEYLSDFCKDYFAGVASLLCSFHKLEKLVIDVSRISKREYNEQSSYVYDSGDNYWELLSQEQDFSSLLLHLKTIEIFGLGAHYNRSQEVLPLIEFLIKNGKVLEKVIVYDPLSFEADNLFKMTEILLCFQRCSP